MLFFSFNPFTDWLSSPSFLSVFDLDWPQPKPQLQQNLPQPRPPTAKPKDPDSYDFGGNEEAAKDYRYDKKHYNTVFENHPKVAFEFFNFGIFHQFLSI